MILPTNDQRPDPYLQWALGTGLEGFAQRTRMPVLLDRDAAPRQVTLRPLYGAGGGSAQLRFATGWLELPAAGPAAEGPVPSGVLMSLPIVARTAPATRSMRRLATMPGPAAARTLIGVIDRGCAFLNESFARHGKPSSTRLLAVWQQQLSDAPGSTLGWTPEEFGYGRVIDREAIDAELLAAAEGLRGNLSAADRIAHEVQAYERWAYPQPWGAAPDPALAAADPASAEQRAGLGALHGTFVLDAVGGLLRDQLSEGFAKPGREAAAAEDAAGEADLVFVDIPEPGSADTTGASADAYILDAVHFILQCAESRRCENVVINLSIGANGGPHDGSGLLEQALDELRAAYPAMVIVAAVGNAHGESWNAWGRSSTGKSASLWWQTRAGDPTDSFLELWFSPAKANGPPPRVKVELTAPDGQSLSARPGEMAWLTGEPPGGLATQAAAQAGAQAVAAVFNQTQGALGQGPMALIALAPSQATQRASSMAGLWRVTLTVESLGEVEINAWIQRDESGPDGTRRQSVIAYASPLFEIDGADSVTSLAMCASVVPAFAGSTEAFLHQPADAPEAVLAPYCSRYGRGRRGEGRRQAHLWATPVELGPTAQGLWGTGAGSGTLVRASGSSIAAPVVARWHANEASRGAKQAPLASLRQFGGFRWVSEEHEGPARPS